MTPIVLHSIVDRLPALAISCAVVAATLLPAHAAETPDATEIVRRAEEHLRGRTSYSELTMTLVRPGWSRTIAMKSWSKGSDRSLILVTAPARDRGTTFLKRGHDVWSWVPGVERVIKIPPSMMSQSWMGSDFANDDLVKESSIVSDYTQTITGDSTLDGRACWKILLLPRPESAVVWGKVLVWIDKRGDLELRREYYDEDGVLVDVMRSSAVRTIGGRLLPTVLEMSPMDKPGNRTVLTYQAALFDEPIADSFFSEQNMKRVR